MKEIGIDIETYSETDIKSGVYKYTEDKNFEVLLFAYSVDNGPVHLVDFAHNEELPEDIYKALTDPRILKTAYNASFEMTCLSKWFKISLNPEQWSCTMALASQAGLPFGLDNVAKVLKTSTQKDSRGKDLIKYFSIPCKQTKTNGMRTRNLPEHDFEKWMEFRSYCMDDVKTEQDIRKQLQWFSVSPFEYPMWFLDQKINNRGVMIDEDLVTNAIGMEFIYTGKLVQQITDIAQIENPQSNAQIKKFILDQTGEIVDSLIKEEMPNINKKFEGTLVGDVLKIREKIAHAAVKKYTAMSNSVSKDKRIRGLFNYNGANRTGRWTSVKVQLQNLKRNDLEDLDMARELVKKGDLETLEFLYDDVNEVLSNLVRTAFIPTPGSDLIVSDFSAIEARVVAWLANEAWRLEVFKSHGKIYEASASMMFGIPMDKIDSELRRRGKIAELALGYQGSVGAMEKMGGSKMGLSLEDMQSIVNRWRKANKRIVKFWYDVQAVVEDVLVSNSRLKLPFLKFYKKEKNLIIQLPSGRELVYIDAKYTGSSIVYYGMNQTTKQWSMLDTYGGKLVENIVQAVSRDILADAMKRVDHEGYDIIMHVHDEIVIEGNPDCKDKITSILSTPIPWAAGLPLKAETFTCKYYQK